ncbi:cytochrome oxidase assembly factor 4-like [Xenia sp. Carnegie-2017]|uniref:cytochrome oxidase assembly factor 4-like n=1 Tax=Xenia sp. Carnegie-2017 TaxID=2897299 RepID=UPI001F03D117|nr:cytochrome oxidase assembly factor 4-like [Xenia sp. Carnegie-2017]
MSSKEIEIEEEDDYDRRINNSGCAVYHYALQDCYAKNKDWRKCTKEMAEFKKCFEENKENQTTSLRGTALKSAENTKTYVED